MNSRHLSVLGSIFLTFALLTTVAWPAIVLGAQDGAARIAPLVAQDDDLSPGAPLSTAAVVPATAPIYVAMTVDQDAGQWTQTEALLRRIGLGDMLPQATEVVADEALSDEADLSALFDGEMAFVVADFSLLLAADESSSMGGDAEQPDGVAFVFAPRDPDAADVLARDLTEQDALDRATRILEVEVGDQTIYYAPGDRFEGGTAYVRLGDLLVVSATPDDLEPFIAAAAGQSTPLSEDEVFVRLSGELSDEFLAFGFVNGLALQEGFEALMAPLVMSAAPPASMASLEDMIDSLEAYTAFVVWADEPGFRFDSLAVAAEGSELPPVPDNFDSTLDERVPADTLLFVNGYDLGPTLSAQYDAAAAAMAQAAAQDPYFPVKLPLQGDEAEQAAAVWALVGRFLTFNPRTDLLDQLVGEWGLALSLDLEDPALISGVLVSGADNELRLNDTITKLAVWFNMVAVLVVVSSVTDSVDGPMAPSLLDQPFGATTEEIDGVLTQVIEIPIPDFGATVRLQWGIVDGELVFGLGEGFGTYVAGPAAVLADNPRYQAIMAELPDEHFAVVYLDLGQIIELAMPFIEAELASEAGGFAVGTPEPVELPDLSAIQALATVGFLQDDLVGTSTLLMIAS
jgi:hypothetical protein